MRRSYILPQPFFLAQQGRLDANLDVRNFVVAVPADIFVSATDRMRALVACLGSCGALGWHIVADRPRLLSAERPAPLLHRALGRTRQGPLSPWHGSPLLGMLNWADHSAVKDSRILEAHFYRASGLIPPAAALGRLKISSEMPPPILRLMGIRSKLGDCRFINGRRLVAPSSADECQHIGNFLIIESPRECGHGELGRGLSRASSRRTL
jgi:hypothetical protein